MLISNSIFFDESECPRINGYQHHEYLLLLKEYTNSLASCIFTVFCFSCDIDNDLDAISLWLTLWPLGLLAYP